MSFKRKLSSYERFIYLSSANNPFNIAVLLNFKGDFTLVTLKKGLEILQKRHPLLKVSIKNEKDPYFTCKNVGKIPLKIISRKVDAKKLLNNELHTSFPNERGPLARCIFIQNKEKSIILTFHHLIIDGIGVNFLVQELFTILDDLTEGKKIKKIIHLHEKKSLESLLKIKNKYRIKLEKPNKEKRKIETGFLIDNLSPRDTQKLIKVCHKKKLSVLSVIFTSYLITLAKKIVKEKKNYPIEIEYHFPINLRPIFNIEQKELGCFIAMPFFDIEINEKSKFWTLAKSIHENIHGILNKLFLKQMIIHTEQFLKTDPSYKKIKEIFIWKKPFLGISNFGKLSVDKHFKHTSIEKIYFLIAMHGNFGSCNNLFVMLWTFNNSLFFSLLYPKPLLSKKEAKNLQKETLKILKRSTN
ncbi:MAG: hypothetical protein HZB76_02275 [Chlamydiae bacterium]|nr:hypothetical protein [Chlamydiota bacterium]